jgi:hypothetical protein
VILLYYFSSTSRNQCFIIALTYTNIRTNYLWYTSTFAIYIVHGRDSSVSIAARYELGGPGIEFRWGRYFPHPSGPALGHHPASYTRGTGPFPRVKWPGNGVDHPPPSSTKVKEIVELYRYSHFGPSWPFLG